MAKLIHSSRQLPGRPPTVFDRLLDFDPDKPDEVQIGHREQLRRHRESIRRDLETLLNTQQPPQRLADGLPEIPTSLVQFGSTGFHGLMLATREQHVSLAKSLQNLIATFEPRLRNVKVSLADDRSRKARTLALKISAETRFADVDEPLAFDTQLDPATRQFRISGDAQRG